ncbi:MAG: hypothetical protein AAGF97_08490 [Planctomycetota bacterium]
MRFTTTILAGLALMLIAVTSPVDAQLSLISQSRSVSAEATICDGPVDASILSSSAAGLFAESTSESMDGWEATAAGALCIEMDEEYSGAATQDTNISTSIIQGFGTATAGKSGGVLEPGYGKGDSDFSVTFELTSPMSYELFGEVAGEAADVGGFYPGEANVTLLQGSSVIHSVDPFTPDPDFGGGSENAFAFSGVLSPGVYTLNAYASAMSKGYMESGDSSSFSFTFVPEPDASAVLLVGLLLAWGKSRKR